MQFLQELASTDGTALARIFKNGEKDIVTEYYVDGTLKHTTHTPTISLQKTVAEAKEWLSSIQTLNG